MYWMQKPTANANDAAQKQLHHEFCSICIKNTKLLLQHVSKFLYRKPSKNSPKTELN